jgi:hypothetical protein
MRDPKYDSDIGFGTGMLIGVWVFIAAVAGFLLFLPKPV